MKRTHIIVHHTGAEEKDAGQVKRYHLSLGWRDIGYNCVIERSGVVVEGRPLNIPGAHCRAQNMNHRSIGVAVIGNMEKHPMPPAQWKALVDLLQILSRRHGIQVQNILGHREVPGSSTACPGRYTDMKALRSAIGRHGDGSSVPEAKRRANGKTMEPSPCLPEPSPCLPWRVQVGAFTTRENAAKLARQLKQKGIDAFVVKNP